MTDEQQRMMKTEGMVYYIVISAAKERIRGRGLMSIALQLA